MDRRVDITIEALCYVFFFAADTFAKKIILTHKYD